MSLTLLLDPDYTSFFSLIINGVCLILTIIELGLTIAIYNTKSVILFMLLGLFCLLNLLAALFFSSSGSGRVIYTSLLPSIILIAANIYFLINKREQT